MLSLKQLMPWCLKTKPHFGEYSHILHPQAIDFLASTMHAPPSFKLDPHTDPAFGAFSWDEHAALDLPAMMTTALAVSGQRDLYYVGYSQVRVEQSTCINNACRFIRLLLI